MSYIDCEKITQALNLIADWHGGSIERLCAMKVLWAADRYHLRKYGRLVLGDRYCAMDCGPVPSSAKDIAKLNPRMKNARVVVSYAEKYLSVGGDKDHPLIVSKQKPDLDFFSQTDIEALKLGYSLCGNISVGSVVELGHKFPEWKKFELQLKENPKTSFKMDYMDFFENSNTNIDQPFSFQNEHLETSKEIFAGNQLTI
ncbi:MAG: Panacea domain-containing protein [Candidatus Gracilibacteria bacterium]|nr:Panacea domain-containing protein [Candidatus Gracilibacteria bacterium]MDD5178814.1 Panacea domain-containing protein [Candidatus Gracilibacteria bacterium]